MNIKELVSEIIGVYEEMGILKTENESFKRDNNSLKSALDAKGKLEPVGEANESLKLRFFNNYIAFDTDWVIRNIFHQYSFPYVYETHDDEQLVIPFAKWLSKFEADDIDDDVLKFMNVQEVTYLFENNLKDFYNEKVAQFKKDNQE